MIQLQIFEAVEAAAAYLQARMGVKPRVGIVLGSGWGGFADLIDGGISIPFAEIPGFSTTTVAGHAGRLSFCAFEGEHLALLEGRLHYYEGLELPIVTLPIRVLARIGVEILILTSASGGIQSSFSQGTIAILSDHINLLGSNPLRGPDDPRLGPRFPDMSQVYDPSLANLARTAGSRQGLTLPEAVYACVAGPSYETPAEIRMLRALGADVVGMSTVPEAIVANQAGMRVLAVTLVTNAAAGVSPLPLDHGEVLAVGRASSKRLSELLREVVSELRGQLS